MLSVPHSWLRAASTANRFRSAHPPPGRRSTAEDRPTHPVRTPCPYRTSPAHKALLRSRHSL
ncbi:MAG TPA: hypothetical protein DHU56_05390 [Marinobacter sp.]|nr:hypothetical protein [Marinobacter sp.]